MALVETLVLLTVMDGSARINTKTERMKADTARSMWGDVFFTRRDTLDVYLRDSRLFRIVTKGKSIDKHSFCYYSADEDFAIGFLAKNGDEKAKFEVVFKTDRAVISTEHGEYLIPNGSTTDNKTFSASLK